MSIIKPEVKIKALNKALEHRYYKQPKLKEIKIKLFSRQIKYSEKYDLNAIAQDNELLEDIEKERWNRQIRNTILNQKKIKDAKVVVFGCGGIGSNALLGLSYFGVYNFRIIDFDEVEISNLNQQTLYYPEDIGSLKVNIAKKRLLQINPKIYVKSYNMKLDYPKKMNLLEIKEAEYPKNIEKIDEIIKWGDFIVSASDYYGAQYLINDLCIKNHKPYYWGVCNYFLGDIYSFYPEEKSACLRCIFGPTDFFNKTQFFRYLTSDSLYKPINLGTTNMITGISISHMIVKDICKINTLIHGHYMIYDGYDFKIYKIPIKSDNNCLCSKFL